MYGDAGDVILFDAAALEQFQQLGGTFLADFALVHADDLFEAEVARKASRQIGFIARA